MSLEKNKNLEMHAIICGRVHGVGFRASTYDEAVKLNLCGTVQNLSNGTVEIFAQGTESQLKTLLSNLQNRFGAEYIQNIEVSFYSSKEVFSDFNILI